MDTLRTFLRLCHSRPIGIVAFSLAIIIQGTALRAQMPDPVISGIINQVSLDSISTYVKVLSGEMGSKNGGSTDTIKSRFYSSASHNLATTFLRTKLQSLGLSTQLQAFGGNGSPSGTNVLGTLTGTVYPGRKYIICAHYDDEPSGAVAPGADDNASGCAAVLEAARLLSKYTPSYTLVFALWDLEEVGLQGSQFYADLAEERRDTIAGVLNMEMFGWDHDNDSVFEIHTDDVAQSVQLADTLMQVNTLYNIGLNPIVYNPGTTSSDHAAFWIRDYTAVVFSEAYYGGDFNTSYHSRSDRIRNFNLSYFLRCSKLGVGTFAFLAGIKGPLDVAERDDIPSGFILSQNYPNPFNPSTTVRFGLPYRSNVTLTIYNTLGQQVAELVRGEQESGFHEIRFDGSNLASGIYFYRLSAVPAARGNRYPGEGDVKSEGFIASRKMILVK